MSQTVWLRSFFLLTLFGFLLNPGVHAQILDVTDTTTTPVPGIGHDYIHLLNETVNPANGSVSLSINVPLPPGRKLSIPFAITYNSNGENQLQDPASNGNYVWKVSQGYLFQGGWGYSAPSFSYAQQTSSSPQVTCTWGANYVFTDPSGAPHALYLEVGSSSRCNFGCGIVQCARNVLNGGDGQYSAQTQPGSTTGIGFQPQPVIVSGPDGTVYFYGGSGFGDTSGFNTLRALASVEDRNGNFTGFGQSANGSITMFDSVGRSVVTTSGFGPSGTSNTLTVSGLSQPYQIAWETVLANYSVPALRDPSTPNCAVNFPQVQNSQVVVQAITLPNGQKYQFFYDASYGLLSEVLYPSGAWVKYTWKPSDQYSEAITFQEFSSSYNGPCDYTYSPPVVATRTVSFNGTSAALTQSFQYTTTWSTSTQKTTTVTTTDNVTNAISKTVYTYKLYFTPQDPSSNTIGQIPVETQVQYYGSGSAPLRTETKNWLDYLHLACDFTTLDNGQVSGAFYTYGIGNQVTDVKQYDFGQLAASACQNSTTAPSTPTPLREVSTTYHSFGNTNIYPNWNANIYPNGNAVFSAPSSIITYGNGVQLAETDYSYDQATVASVSNLPSGTHDETNYPPSYNNRGNLTTVTQKCFYGAQTCTNATTTYTYDETGQALSSTDACGNASCSDMTGTNHRTTFSYADNYDSNPSTNTNALLTKTTNALGQSSSFKYAYSDGQLIQFTDPNSNSTSYLYGDSLRRLTETDYPDNGKTTLVYNDTPPNPTVTTNRLMVAPSQYVTTVATMDGIGHVIKTLTSPDPDCGSGDRVDNTYDGFGRVHTVSNPYCSTSDPTYGITTYAYDALGRTTQVAHPDNSTILTAYTGRATQVQDEGNGTQRVTRISQVDGLGRFVSVCEVSSASLVGQNNTPASCGQDISGTGFLTTYQYDAQDNLTQINQGTMSPRTFAYDSLSRLTSATNPESGTYTYSYDANGNVLTRTGPTQTVTTYQYDALNRLLSKSYNDHFTTTATYVYDVSSSDGYTFQNPVGRLVKESTPTVCAGQCAEATAIWNSYDQMGRIINQWQQCGYTWCNNVFSIPYTYNFLGQETSMGDGIGGTNSYSYSTAARLISATSNWSDSGHPGTFISNITYNAAGQELTAKLGNGLTETRSYDKRLRPVSFSVGPLYSWTIPANGYAPNSDIVSSTDSANGNWTYSYDAFNRLSGSNQNNGASVYSYTYDRFGNRWQQSGPYTFTASFTGNNPSNPQNNNRIDGYSYDAAGNMTSDGFHTYSYDAENRLIYVDNNNTAQYGYDAEGRRAYNSKDGAYLYDLEGHPFDLIGGGLHRGEFYAPGRHLGTYNGNTTYFNLTDWLSTERVRTTITGTLYETCTNLPFGDVLSCTGSDPSPMHFTGKEHDNETGLDNFGARYLTSSMGRFMSPDPANAGASIDNPQSWNAYSYVLNNPISFVDPDGLQCVWDDGSYDSADDPTTGSFQGCTKAGGTYYDPNSFQAPGGQDWSSAPNSDLASQVAREQQVLVDPNAPCPSGTVCVNTSEGELNTNAAAIFGTVWNRLRWLDPETCGGGYFVLRGIEGELPPIHAHGGGYLITNHDSRAGNSVGYLFEGGGGPISVGQERTVNLGSGEVDTSYLLFAGKSIGKGNKKVDVGGFGSYSGSNSPIQLGVYGSFAGRGGGGYYNFVPGGGCK